MPVRSRGFTLAEIVVGAAVFVIVGLAAYNAFVSIFKLANANQARVLAVELASEQFEILRNMPYSSIGIAGGVPPGTIPHVQTIVRGGISFTVTTTIRNIDLPFDGMIGSSTPDLSPADNKMAEVNIDCTGCENWHTISITGQIAPKNLETASSNGSLFIQVFDSNGVGVPQATVMATDIATTAPVVINDVTNDSGILQVIDAPTGTNAYSIVVSKAGYSTERTYKPGLAANPTPSKPHPTVLQQQITPISFSIDKVSTLNFMSVTPTCSAVPNFDFSMVGNKQIGANVPKYSQSMQTNGSGRLTLNNMEWDSYSITPTDATYDLAGINPLSPIVLAPDTVQNVELVAVPRNPMSLVITVTDSATHLPLPNATVHVTGPDGYDQTFTTGVGFLDQSDWSGGAGQDIFGSVNRYFIDDNNVDTATSSGNILLKQVFGSYNPSGVLESSTFDTGSPSNFYAINWTPAGQPLLTGPDSVRLQFASNATITPTTTWSYIGPDGTSATYFNNPGGALNASHNGKEFVRYKVFLSTLSPTSTPNVSDVSFTYTSDCVPSGQVILQGLESGTYSITVSKVGYTPSTSSVNVGAVWQQTSIILAP